MATDSVDALETRIERQVLGEPTGWLKKAQEEMRVRGNSFPAFEPLDLPGTPLSELIIQERRGEL